MVMSPKRGSRKRKAAEENDTDEPNAGQSVEEYFNKGAKKRKSWELGSKKYIGAHVTISGRREMPGGTSLIAPHC